MKKILLACTFIFCIQFTFGQTTYSYVPFPDSNATWLQFFESDVNSSQSVCSEKKFEITTDTIIGGLTYHILKQSSYDNPGFQGCAPPGNGTVTTNLFGAIRNDVLNKRVWLRQFSNNKDTLFYDFNLQVGDTATNTFLIDSANLIFEVVRIDTVLYGNSLRRQIIFGNNFCADTTQSIIEGIGSTRGLITPPLQRFCLNAQRAELVCMQQNSIPTYPDTSANCNLITSLSETTQPHGSNFQIYPNPTFGKLYISANEKFKKIEIYTVFGIKLKEIIPSETGIIQLQLNEKPGIYILKFQLKDGLFISKKILLE